MSTTKDINIENFKKIIKKLTLDSLIDNVRINFSKDKVWSGMKTSNRNVVIFLRYDENNVITPLNDEISLNFANPSKNLKPYLDLIDGIAKVKIDDEKILIESDSSKCNIHTCQSDAVSTILMEKDPAETLTPFLELKMDDDIIEKFEKIKKIAQRFDKIYFTTKNKQFFVESTDKSINFCNSLNLKLCDLDMEDFSLLFDFKYFRSILSVINGDNKNFKVKFNLIKSDQNNTGLILFEKNDKSERYYLVSSIDDDK